MKEDLRMSAMSPDPDDLAEEAPPERGVPGRDERADHPGRTAPPDRSAPHIPLLEKGRIRGKE